jgi:hypothetical protein
MHACTTYHLFQAERELSLAEARASRARLGELASALRRPGRTQPAASFSSYAVSSRSSTLPSLTSERRSSQPSS